jgi:beta-glucosidase
LNRDTALHFAEYARVVGEALGDRVNRFITLNEPWVSSFIGYTTGHHAPGLQDLGSGVIAAHNLLYSHGLAVKALRATAQASEVGLTLNLSPAIAASSSERDIKAARRVDDQLNRWFLDPVLKGSYPEELLAEHVAYLGGDFIHEGDLTTIAAPIDFLGINYYTRNILAARTTPHESWSRATTYGDFLDVDDVTAHSTPRTTKDWPIDPEGLHDVLVWVAKEYGPIALFVTENGAAFLDYVDQGGSVHDEERIEYLQRHFAAAHRAIEGGVDLRGYYVWSLFDNFEWADGYSQRFGLVFIDYQSQARILKDSAKWFTSVIGSNAVDQS